MIHKFGKCFALLASLHATNGQDDKDVLNDIQSVPLPTASSSSAPDTDVDDQYDMSFMTDDAGA